MRLINTIVADDPVMHGSRIFRFQHHVKNVSYMYCVNIQALRCAPKKTHPKTTTKPLRQLQDKWGQLYFFSSIANSVLFIFSMALVLVILFYFAFLFIWSFSSLEWDCFVTESLNCYTIPIKQPIQNSKCIWREITRTVKQTSGGNFGSCRELPWPICKMAERDRCPWAQR